MHFKTIISPRIKTIALVSHDNLKPSLIRWCQHHAQQLQQHHLYATGTTSGLIRDRTTLKPVSLLSGPLGGDQQIGALITNQEIDIMIFFWDPLDTQAHDADVKALLRLANLWNIPVACNEASADMLISSPLFANEFPKVIPDYESYIAQRSKQLVE